MKYSYIKRKLRDILVWSLMLSKRLLKTPSFIVLIVMIPLCAALLRFGFSESSGTLNIGLYSEGSDIGEKIVESLLQKESIVSFRRYTSEEEAREAVIADKIQGAWIFPKELPETLEINAEYGGINPLVKVIEREETIPLKLSHELLYGSLHPYVAYENYEKYIVRKFSEKAPHDEETLRSHYADGIPPNEVIIMKVVGEEQAVTEEISILSLPMRGILSLLCVLCATACAMYCLSDKRKGVYNGLSPQKQIFPAFGTIFCGTVMSSAAVSLSLLVLGICTDTAAELCSMLLYIPAVCGFALLLMSVVRNMTVLGGLLPFLMLVMLVQCPIFINADKLRPVWWLFPTSYYLYGVYNPKYLLLMGIYAVTAISAAIIINRIASNKVYPDRRA